MVEVDVELENLAMLIIADQVELQQKFMPNKDVMMLLKITFENLLVNQNLYERKHE